MTERSADTDLGRTLDHRDRHDVGDTDAADNQGEQAHGGDDDLERAVGGGLGLEGVGKHGGAGLDVATEVDGHRQSGLGLQREGRV